MSAEVVVLGSVNVDLRTEVEQLPRPGETIAGSQTIDLLGGKGANQAVASARLGRNTHFIACVGNDPRGVWATERLAAEGLDAADIVAVDGPTGTAIVLVDRSAENLIVVSGGANMKLTAEQAVDQIAPRSEPGHVLLMQLEVPIESVAAAARAFVGTVILNPAPAVALPAALLADVDVLVPNLGELATLTGEQPATSVEEIAQQAKSLGVSQVVVTWGARGCVVVEGDLVTHVESPTVEALDTTGAGDSFCGALADGLASAMTVVDAAARAAVAASFSTLAAGAQTSPTAAELAELLSQA